MFVDTKREGEAPTETKPSLPGFILWLERQPAWELYNIDSPANCALGQYFRSLKCEPEELVYQVAKDFGISGGRLYDILLGQIGNRFSTFGAAAKRGRAIARS